MCINVFDSFNYINIDEWIVPRGTARGVCHTTIYIYCFSNFISIDKTKTARCGQDPFTLGVCPPKFRWLIIPPLAFAVISRIRRGVMCMHLSWAHIIQQGLLRNFLLLCSPLTYCAQSFAGCLYKPYMEQREPTNVHGAPIVLYRMY